MFLWDYGSNLLYGSIYSVKSSGRSICCCPERVSVWVFSESEDEVEEIEERVPSPDGAAEESAPFYDPVAW